jgi:hypothetical protein
VNKYLAYSLIWLVGAYSLIWLVGTLLGMLVGYLVFYKF